MKKIKACDLKVGDVLIIKKVHYIVTIVYMAYNGRQEIITDDGLSRIFPEDFLVTVLD